MVCRDLAECYFEIDAYLHGEPTGYPMLVNAENLDSHNSIMTRLDSNPEVECQRVSNASRGDQLPDIDALIAKLCAPGKKALIGISQYLMLRSSNDLNMYTKQLMSKSIHGHLIVLLYRCEYLLQQWEKKDIRLKNRILFIPGIPSKLPQISIVSDQQIASSANCKQIHGLLVKLETITDDDIVGHPVIAVQTNHKVGLFRQSRFTIIDGNDVFTRLANKYPEVAGCDRNYGTDTQWAFLFKALSSSENLTAFITQHIAPISNLHLVIGDVFQEGDENKKWLLWLGMKLYGVIGNRYLSLAIKRSKQVEDFEESIVMALLDEKHNEEGFSELYHARKRLLDSMPENLPLITQYCQRIGRFEKDSVYYLTDLSEIEEHEFMRFLSIYDYSEKDLLEITKFAFPELYKYLLKYRFTPANMQVPTMDSALRDSFTTYFQEYKQQKLTNRIWPDFMQKVLEYADERPYNKLQARSTLAAKMDKKGAQLFFFDALGVEYLSYIVAKCEQYGLIADISVGICQLPSITEVNKDFIPFFQSNCKKIDALDELKHHSQIYDYQRCKEPIHLFRELEIIDEQLRQIRSFLVQGSFDKAVIISDHGASRLAVINNRQSASSIQMDEKGEHSGRCCPVTADPGIKYAAYTPNGYSVLANYDRFKGGRPANVEVHGGASLEEVIVPLITLTLKPSDIEIVFVEENIQLRGREPVSVTIYANIPFADPILVVDVNGIEKTYHGEFVGDQRHARFVMEDIKRSKKYSAAFYDGAKKLMDDLMFTVQKGTKENSLMGI